MVQLEDMGFIVPLRSVTVQVLGLHHGQTLHEHHVLVIHSLILAVISAVLVRHGRVAIVHMSFVIVPIEDLG